MSCLVLLTFFCPGTGPSSCLCLCLVTCLFSSPSPDQFRPSNLRDHSFVDPDLEYQLDIIPHPQTALTALIIPRLPLP